jgi:SAM-dependent methyltransferase
LLDVRPNHPPATMIADLAAADGIPSNTFDCIILTQTLNFIYDVRGAIKTVHRILRRGGTVLVSASGIAQSAPEEIEYCGDYWRFTGLSLCRLFQEEFPADCIEVESHGNVLAALAFLHGLAVEELNPEELDRRDLNFELTIFLKAVKPLQQA